MDNPVTLAALGTQNTTQKTKRNEQYGPTNTPGVNPGVLEG
jgi:hypothetical protein